MRNRMERSDELAELNQVREQLQDEDAIDGLIAQQLVITNDMTKQDVYEYWPNDTDLRSAALEAVRWLREDDEAPSECWREREYATAC